MATTETKTALENVKKLSTDVSAWETRLVYLQNEEGNMKRKNEQVKKEIESALMMAQQELDKKREQARIETAKIIELTDKLEADKTEFKGILDQFNKEKRIFESDRQKMIDRDADTQKLREKLTNFMLYVKREAVNL